MSARLDRLRSRAAEHLLARQWEPAAARLEALLAELPGDDRARLDLGHAWLCMGRYREARRIVLQACERDRGDPGLAVPRLDALRAFAEHETMLAIGAAVDPQRLPAQDALHGAMALHGIGATLPARGWFDRALALEPGNAIARVNRAWLDLAEGRFDAAEAALETVIAASPCVPMAHWLLSGLRRQTATTHHVDRLRELLAQPGLAPRDEAPLAFALHKECDDLGWHDEAWDALLRGCRARRAAHAYDPAAQVRLLDAIVEHFGPMPASEIPPPTRGPVPIFIVGMHRSGTSLLERMLEGHPEVAAGGESQRLAALLHEATDHRSAGMLDAITLARAASLDHRELGERYLERHAWLAAGRSHFTEKEPDNHRLLGFVRRALPQARVLHLVRDPMDTCWSNLREMFGQGRRLHTYDQIDLAHHYAGYRRLARHWQTTCPGYVHEVSYAALVSDTERELRRVLAFCGLAWHPDCLRVERASGVLRSASAVQVREPVHTRSLARWRPYEARLQPLREALRSLEGRPLCS